MDEKIAIIIVILIDILAVIATIFLSNKTRHAILGALIGGVVHGIRTLILIPINSSLGGYYGDFLGWLMNFSFYKIPILAGIGFFASQTDRYDKLIREMITNEMNTSNLPSNQHNPTQ